MPSLKKPAAAILALAAIGAGLLAAQDRRKAPAAGHIDRVPEITDVKYLIEQIDPPNLVVEVAGVVPTGGWSEVTLLRREYTTPPADGVYEYDLVAVRPAGPAIQVLTPVKAVNVWKAYPTDKVKGVRVYGVGPGVKMLKFDEKK